MHEHESFIEDTEKFPDTNLLFLHFMNNPHRVGAINTDEALIEERNRPMA